MNNKAFDIKIARQYLPHIFFIAIGIGTANYIMHGRINWIQSIILSISTSFIIGFSLVTIILNKSWFESRLNPSWKLNIVFFILFFLLGVIATEVEQLIENLVFSNEKYRPFLNAKMCLFNGIISLMLGFSFIRSKLLLSDESLIPKNSQQVNRAAQPDQNSAPIPPLQKIPVKKGEAIFLIPIQDIVYFEAFDNYSFVYDTKGEKRLCDYSLLFLQKRLDERFMRIHRKYIVNTNHIKQVKPHLNARYIIEFESSKLSPIISSKSYTSSIRTLIKIK